MTNATGDSQLSRELRRSRQALGLSIRELARRAGVNPTTVMRLEDGDIANPTPTTLVPIAEALGLSPSDLLIWANYTAPDDLPSFRPYLRTKYRRLPTETVNELDEAFKSILKKHGYAANGPQAGEDEAA
jgi:transcriptional regulator with XRE-family HTH domain